MHFFGTRKQSFCHINIRFLTLESDLFFNSSNALNIASVTYAFTSLLGFPMQLKFLTHGMGPGSSKEPIPNQQNVPLRDLIM